MSVPQRTNVHRFPFWCPIAGLAFGLTLLMAAPRAIALNAIVPDADVQRAIAAVGPPAVLVVHMIDSDPDRALTTLADALIDDAAVRSAPRLDQLRADTHPLVRAAARDLPQPAAAGDSALGDDDARR